MNWFKKLQFSQRIRTAENNYNHKAYQKALDQFTKARLLFPKSPIAISGIAACHYMLNDSKKAIEFINIALEIDPYDLNQQLNKLYYLTADEQYEKALLISNSLLKYYRDDPNFMNERMHLFLNLQQYESALVIAKHRVRINPPNSYNYSMLAACYSGLHETEKSIEMLELALIENPKDVISLNNIGFERLNLQEYEKAIIDFDKAISLEEYAYAYNNKGFALLKLGRLEDALFNINHSLTLDNKNSYAYKNKALYYLEMDHEKKALENLFKAKDLNFQKKYGDEVEDLIKKIQSSH